MPTAIDRIYLDIDGVLTDFTTHAHQRLGVKFDLANWPYPYGNNGWDWHKELGYSLRQLSLACSDALFWQTMPWLPDGRTIWKIVRDFAMKHRIPIFAATSIMCHPGAAEGKLRWIRIHLPELVGKTVVFDGRKSDILNPDCALLIDDCEHNVNAFADRGGNIILVPRHWNRDYANHRRAPESVSNQLQAHSLGLPISFFDAIEL